MKKSHFLGQIPNFYRKLVLQAPLTTSDIYAMKIILYLHISLIFVNILVCIYPISLGLFVFFSVVGFFDKYFPPLSAGHQ